MNRDNIGCSWFSKNRQNIEYLVIRTYPYGIETEVLCRTEDYFEAKDKCTLENLVHDYSSFAVRCLQDDTLYEIDLGGIPGEKSLQQLWQIDPYYLAASLDWNIDSVIRIHSCSYPYFVSPETKLNDFGQFVEYWQPVICLVDDSGSEIRECPNCGGLIVNLDN